MTNESLSIKDPFPRAIVHIDGDAFFASCEQMQNPKLRGKPVVTGLERGIASSMSYEAKACGVTRAMPLHEIRKICPEVVILPSDYELYSLMSLRMYDIVRRYTEAVEEYGIDECFADITGIDVLLKMNYEKIVEKMKRELDTELGVTFSVGLAPTKVLAKVASKWKKPSGLTLIRLGEINSFLDKWPVERVWGIGPQTTNLLNKKGIKTSFEFVGKDLKWIDSNLSKPFKDIWYELRGVSTMELELEKKMAYKSISKTKTFTPPSRDKNFVLAQLSKNVENACIKARRYHQASSFAYIFLKTQDFRFVGAEVKLNNPSSIPSVILREIREVFDEIFNERLLYRATGVVLTDLKPELMQMDLFGESETALKMYKVYEFADKVSDKFGKHTLFLGSSFLAHKNSAHKGSRSIKPDRHKELLKGETDRKRLNIPLIGTVG